MLTLRSLLPIVVPVCCICLFAPSHTRGQDDPSPKEKTGQHIQSIASGSLRVCILINVDQELAANIDQALSFQDAKRLIDDSSDRYEHIWFSRFDTVTGFEVQQTLGKSTPVVEQTKTSRGNTVRDVRYSDQGGAFSVHPKPHAAGVVMTYEFDASYFETITDTEAEPDEANSGLVLQSPSKINVDGAVLFRGRGFAVQEFQNNDQHVLIVIEYHPEQGLSEVYNHSPDSKSTMDQKRDSIRQKYRSRMVDWAERMIVLYDVNQNGQLDTAELEDVNGIERLVTDFDDNGVITLREIVRSQAEKLPPGMQKLLKDSPKQ